MSELSPVNRPVSLRELAIGLGLNLADMETLTLRHRIKPACRIDGMAVYGPKQIRAVHRVLEMEARPCPV